MPITTSDLTTLLNSKKSKYSLTTPFAKQLAFSLITKREALFGGCLGGGKVLYDDSQILTPFGYKLGKDISVGDNVSNPDGSVCKIIQKHPEQNFQVWRVNFNDGTSTDVAREHLWEAWVKGKTRKHKGTKLTGRKSSQVFETQELKKIVDSGKKVFIPICEPQPFNRTTRGSLIDPYLFGAWLGDGHTSFNAKSEFSVGFTSIDIEHFSDYLEGGTWSAKKGTEAKTFKWNGAEKAKWHKELSKFGLHYRKSHNKFIPEIYKLSSIEKRISLVQGMMDTDGYIDKRGHASYSTSSKQLADDMTFVLRSLGCYVKICEKQTDCRLNYNLYIKQPEGLTLFRLERKLSRVKPKMWEPRKVVVSIEVLDQIRTGRCITVSHTNGLYITNDFIVTHNSEAVLQLALSYVHIPNFSCLILRKTLADLKLPEALLDRMMTWMAPYLATKEVKYIASEHKFVFKTYHPVTGERTADATINFGYIGESNARTRYQGAEFNLVIFDELCQHTESDYTYLFTRLRKCVCPTHKTKDKKGHPVYFSGCQECKWAQEIPTMMRATCNPEGIGFAWVKKRFKIGPNMSQEDADHLGVEIKWIGKDPERPFLPSTFLDNPHLNHKEYGDSLKNELSDEMYQALVLGSWGVVPNARFKKKWKKVYSQYANLMYLGRGGTGKIIDSKRDYQKIFLTVDTATTAMEGPGDTDMFPTKVKNPSWTVICAWGLAACYNLLMLEMMRFREEIPDVVDELKSMYERWNPVEAVVEENGVGKGVSQFASKMGMNIVGLNKGNDKVENATEAILQMRNGRIWLPEYADWLEEAENELFTWQGHPKETDDIIDNISHAANHVDWSKASNHISVNVEAQTRVAVEKMPGAFRSNFIFRPH